MPTLTTARCADCPPDNVEASLDAVLSPLGGMAAFVSPGHKVLLKVDLLSKALPE